MKQRISNLNAPNGKFKVKYCNNIIKIVKILQ